jgi:hypothetical protein
LKSSISIGGNWRHTNTKTHGNEKLLVKCVFVLVGRQFPPILILLFKHFRKLDGVQKFLSEYPSYIFIYDAIDLLPKNLTEIFDSLERKILTVWKREILTVGKGNFDSLEREILTVWKRK